MSKNESLIQYGTSFQSKIITSLLVNNKFIKTVYDILEISYFDSDANTTINFIYDSYPHVNTISGVIPGTLRKISTIDGPTFILDSIGALP